MKPNQHLMLKKDLLKYNTGHCRHGHRYCEHPNCWWVEQKKKPKVGYLDIETSNLDANYGMILTYCILDDDTSKILEGVIDIKDVRKGLFDKNLCKQLIQDILKFDIIKGYWSTGFDIPFIRSRSLRWRYNFPIYKSIDHKDIYYMVKRLLKLNNNKLETATQFLNIKGKNHINGETWMKAYMCDGKEQEKSIAEILDHNRRDVIILRRVDKRLEEFDRGIVKSI